MSRASVSQLDLLATAPPWEPPWRKRVEEVFWRRVSIGPDANDCWYYSGPRNQRGYGQIASGVKALRGAHRFSWALHNRRLIPDGRWVLHSCDRPPCVNPAHLRLGSPEDNTQDRIERCRGRGPEGAHHDPTKRQIDILRFIESSVRKRGVPPSIREIGAHFLMASTNGVNDQLKALERKGLILRGRCVARALVLTAEGIEALTAPRQEAQ